jgi:hypothetical protein
MLGLVLTRVHFLSSKIHLRKSFGSKQFDLYTVAKQTIDEAKQNKKQKRKKNIDFHIFKDVQCRIGKKR